MVFLQNHEKPMHFASIFYGIFQLFNLVWRIL